MSTLNLDSIRKSDVVHVAEFIKDRLYFVTLKTSFEENLFTAKTVYLNFDFKLQYDSFYSDFGPLNLSKLYRYCKTLKDILSDQSDERKILHCTNVDSKIRVNNAFLIGSYAIIYLKKTPAEAYQLLVGNNSPLYIPFRDASFGHCTYKLTLSDCFHAVSKAVENDFLDFQSFDVKEYEHYEMVENGDLNWIIPNKFIAFCGPHSKTRIENGYPVHSPEYYIDFFRKNNVTTIIRLNKKAYDAQRFTNHGFDHHDLFFIDGSTPSDKIMKQFLEIAENTKGAIAIHCKAGLGRTGTLIACYIMKHHHFTAAEAIAWTRICRPGSIIGDQQYWLEGKQGALCYQGNIFRAQKSIARIQLDERSRKRDKPKKVDNNNEEEEVTQGDKLNRIKARRQPRSHTTGGFNLDNIKPFTRSSSQPFKPAPPTGVQPASPMKPPAALSPLRRPTRQPASTHSPNKRRGRRQLATSPRWDCLKSDSANGNLPSEPNGNLLAKEITR